MSHDCNWENPTKPCGTCGMSEELSKELSKRLLEPQPFDVDKKVKEFDMQYTASYRWKNEALQNPSAADFLREALHEAFEAGIGSVLSIRCLEHRAVPQLSESKLAGEECGACVWREVAQEIAKEMEGLRPLKNVHPLVNKNDVLDKAKKCELCLFFSKSAVGYIELTWASTRRTLVCQKHKARLVAQNERERFSNPTFAPKLTFHP